MVEEISPETLNERIARGEDVQIVDIRQPDEFEEGHIPGAENVPFHTFAREVGSHDWGDDIVVACPMGESSQQACRLLEAFEGVDEDATVSNLTGGYNEWEYDLETGPARVEE